MNLTKTFFKQVSALIQKDNYIKQISAFCASYKMRVANPRKIKSEANSRT